MSSEATATHIRLVEDSGQPSDRLSSEGFGEDLAGGLPVYHNPTLEGVESTLAELDARADRIQLKRGAVAHVVSANRVYSERDLEQLSGRMNIAYSTVLDWQATYRRLLRLSDQRRIRVMSLDLRYSHFRALNNVDSDDDYEALLIRANKKRWSVGKLSDALYHLQRERQAQAARDSVQAPLISEPPEVSRYREEGTPVEESAPTPPAIEPDELATVGAEYERDVIERFCDWLVDNGISLVDNQGEVLENALTVERYARAEL